MALGRHLPYARLERTERPEEERVGDFRSRRPLRDNQVLGETQRGGGRWGRSDVLENAAGCLRRKERTHGGRILARSHARLANVTSQAVSLKRKTGNGARYSRLSVIIATQCPGSCSRSLKMGSGPAASR